MGRSYLSLLLLFLLLLVGCSDSVPTADATYYGYVTVWVIPGRGELHTLVNGDTEIYLLTDENTEFVNAVTVRGQPAISFDAVYRADGAVNVIPGWMRDEDGQVIDIGIADTADTLWVTRLERLGADEAEATILAGKVVRRE